MTRSATKGTPVVDFIDVMQTIQYREEVNITNKDVSAVDNATTGVKTLQKISDCGFTFPSSNNQIVENQGYINAAPITYQLKDQTRRPSDVMIYLKSESGKGARTDRTSSSSDEVIAKAIQRKVEYGEATGVLMNYQYGAGKVQYLRPYERELDSTFTPSLLDEKKYRYYIKNGWPNEQHTVITGQKLTDLAEMYSTTTTALKNVNKDIVTNEDGTLLSGQLITIPNTSLNSKVSLKFKNNTLYTEKSSHNALYDQNHGSVVTDFSSETISVSVPQTPPPGYVDWVSEEKIYTGVINANDTREEFIRTQYNRSSYSDFYRDYKVVSEDTWDSISDKYDINVNDLKLANESLESISVGDVIKIPPNIILPELASEAEFEKDNPYEIHIIEDSVHKKTEQKSMRALSQ
ncbi:LysM peptidoglycan-binding domain-containing protein [Priestia megaterium]